MNQILNKNNLKNKNKLVSILRIQILFSIIGIIALIFFSKTYSQDTKISENYSKEIFVNQKLGSIYKAQILDQEEDTSNNLISNIFCSIEIPKLKIIYPVFNEISEELLNLSPCKFSGPNLNENGNISIAGHNLENHTFFSDLYKIEINDTIYLHSNLGETFEYYVYRTYETISEDLTPIATNFIEKKELTLVTCNNTNKKRFIVKALLNNTSQNL